MLNSFRDFLLLNEASEPKFCYMLFTESPFTEQLVALQQSLHIEAEKLIAPDKFHCTVRYCKLIGQQNPDRFLEWLGKQQLPILECFTEKFTMFEDKSLVMELDSPQIREWEAKVNGFMNLCGYAPSEFPSFRPHISLAYGCTSLKPIFDVRKHRLNVKFTIHRVTDQNKQPIFDRKVQNYKGLQYGLTG